MIIGILLPFIFNVNLDQLHGFYTFELFGCLFQLQKTFFLSFSNCLLVFFNKICTYCLLIIHMGSKKKSYCRRAAMFLFGQFVLLVGGSPSAWKTLHKVFSQICLSWIRICIKKAAGSRYALRKTTGSGSAKNECGSSALFPALYAIWYRYHINHFKYQNRYSGRYQRYAHFSCRALGHLRFEPTQAKNKGLLGIADYLTGRHPSPPPTKSMIDKG